MKWAGCPKRPEPIAASPWCGERASEITCAATSESGMLWPETAAGTVQVLGECDSNYRMADGIPPYRACSINGDFETIKNPCLRTSRVGAFIVQHLPAS